MLADDAACNPRNPFAGTVYSNADRKTDLYGDRIEVDYKGEEVNVETFLRLLSGACASLSLSSVAKLTGTWTGRLPDSTPASKRLMTDSRSNIFVYLTGHGGDEFLKFQDNEEISAFDIADAFGGMWAKKRWVPASHASSVSRERADGSNAHAGTTRSSSWSTRVRPTRSTANSTRPTSSPWARARRTRTRTPCVRKPQTSVRAAAD